MEDPVHGRRAAIYDVPQKRLPRSFYLGAGVALLLHAGLAYYLIQQTFSAVVPQEPFVTDRPIVIEMPTKQDPVKAKPTISVHTPAQKVPEKVDPLPAPPQTPTITQTTQPVTELPKVDGPAVGTSSSSTGGSDGPQYINPTWSKFPTGEALADYYPSRAANDEIEGSATVQCAVLDTAGRVSCVVISETPGGYGFGSATVHMVQDKGRVDTTKGNVAVGSMLRQTVKWKF